MVRRPSVKTRAPSPTRPVTTTEIKKRVLAAALDQQPFTELLRLLGSAVGADAGVALLTSDEQHAFRVIDELGISAKQRRALQSWLPSIAEGSSQEASRSQSSGVILVLSDEETKKRGSSSAIIYYLVRSQKMLCALTFFRQSGQFDKKALKILDAVASPVALLAENKYYKEKASAADELAHLDGLTGLFNHHYFQANLAAELLKSHRFEHPVSVMIIDVDHFKKINDKFGHPHGDVVLKEIAQILKETIRAYDVPTRYGGEEFSVVLPHANQGQALQVAQRLRKAVFDHSFPGRHPGEELKLTVSVGVATSPTNAKTKAELIDRADQALYLAKSEGRNRVCLSLVSSTEPVKFGFCPATLNGGYYRDVLAGMEDVVREVKQVELSVHAPDQESDYHLLHGIFQEFVEEGVDAVAVCTQSPTAIRDLKLLHRAKIPVFFFNVPEKIADRKIRSYVGYDQIAAGKTVGAYLGRILRGRGKVAVLEGLAEPTNRLRVAGFQEALAAFTDITIVTSEPADWLAPQARKVTAAILQRHHDLDAIFAVSDAMALGAVEAVKAKKKQGSIFVIGFDGTYDALKAVQDGALTATLDTGPREMGRILLRTMVRGLIPDERVSRQILSPVRIVTAENVDDTMPSERQPQWSPQPREITL